MSSSSVSFSPASPSERFTGRVKWFNNKAGYGFVTITDGTNSGKDVFVHHSSIKVDSEQYKYLVQGEYIEFCLSDTGGVGDHEYQAGEVSGIKGGKLMCETRRDSRSARTQYKSGDDESPETVRMPRATPPPRSTAPSRARGEGPRSDTDKEWTKTRSLESASGGRGAPTRGRGTSGGRGGRGAPSRGSGGRGTSRGQERQV